MSLIEDYQKIKNRLWNPPNARKSSELEISGPLERRHQTLISELKGTIRKRDISIAALQGQMTTLGHELERYRSVGSGGFRPVATNLIEDAPITLKKITEAISLRFHVSAVSILSRKQIQMCARPRLVLYYLAAELTAMSVSEAARQLGRDHTTLLAGIRKVRSLVKGGDVELKTHIAVVKQILGVG